MYIITRPAGWGHAILVSPSMEPLKCSKRCIGTDRRDMYEGLSKRFKD